MGDGAGWDKGNLSGSVNPECGPRNFLWGSRRTKYLLLLSGLALSMFLNSAGYQAALDKARTKLGTCFVFPYKGATKPCSCVILGFVCIITPTTHIY